MKFKKILCALLSAIILLSSITAFADGAEVPYTPNRVAFEAVTFEIDDILDVKRLLELKKEFFTNSFIMIIKDPELRDLAIDYVYEFIEENSHMIANPEKSYARVLTEVSEDMVDVVIRWDNSLGDGYRINPCINSMEQLYNEFTACDRDENYDRIFRLHPDFYSPRTYLSSGLDPLLADFEEEYGEDLSKYMNSDDHFYKLYIDTYYVYISLTHYDLRERENIEATKRYERILKNNIILPITEDMTKEEKLLVITNSPSNIYHSYMITNLRTDNIASKEKTYSVGLGQCHHYAVITKELCDIYGIPCIYVSGQKNTGSGYIDHAWNMIQYNGNWYHTDLTGQRVKAYDLDINDLTLFLSSDTDMEEDYIWNKEKYHQCTSDSITLSNGGFSYTPEVTDTCINVEMFEPYRSKNPMTAGKDIYYNILFDTADGKIITIDTNLSEDKWEKIDNQWKTKETVLTIPSEINGIKVKSIASYADCNHTLGSFDHLYIPDDIVLEEFAFRGLANTRGVINNLHIGNSVTIGYDSLPSFKNYDMGENVVYMGYYLHLNLASHPEYAANNFNSYGISYSEDENITVPNGYTNLIYGVGNNIVDRAPVKTLTLNEDIYYVDPRLGRLNRRFVVPESNPYYTAIDGVLYNKDVTELIAVPVGTEELNIPDTVTKIGPKALEYNNALKSVTFPEAITSFGKEAFHHLSNIERVIFMGDVPDSFEAILCSDFELYSMLGSKAEIIEHRIVFDEIVIENASSLSGRIYVAFYDNKDVLIEVGNGATAKIPPFARSYKIFVLDDNMAPITLDESGTL